MGEVTFPLDYFPGGRSHYCGSTVVYELHPPGNAEALLYVLWYGIHAEEDQLELMKSRQFSMKDLKRPPKL
jgi:hypothetical protein